jgi:hypothetical protein
MTQFKFDIQGHITRCFSQLMRSQIKLAQKALEGMQEETSEPLVIIA